MCHLIIKKYTRIYMQKKWAASKYEAEEKKK